MVVAGVRRLCNAVIKTTISQHYDTHITKCFLIQTKTAQIQNNIATLLFNVVQYTYLFYLYLTANRYLLTNTLLLF